MKNMNPVSWFEIPTEDLAKAKKFYETVFQITLTDAESTSSIQMALFPGDQKHFGATGALVFDEKTAPCNKGTIVFFTCEDINKTLGSVAAQGGKLDLPKTPIGEWGYIAKCIDTEGNKIGLYSMK